MKTAIEELIEYIEEWTPKNKITNGIWSKAKSLLELEKQQIIDAANSEKSVDINYGEQYYKEKFNK